MTVLVTRLLRPEGKKKAGWDQKKVISRSPSSVPRMRLDQYVVFVVNQLIAYIMLNYSL